MYINIIHYFAKNVKRNFFVFFLTALILVKIKKYSSSLDKSVNIVYNV